MQEKTSLFTDAVSRLLSNFALVKDIVFSRQIGFVKSEEKGRVCFGYALARTDDKPRAISSLLEYCRGAKEEDDCQACSLAKNHGSPINLSAI